MDGGMDGGAVVIGSLQVIRLRSFPAESLQGGAQPAFNDQSRYEPDVRETSGDKSFAAVRPMRQTGREEPQISYPDSGCVNGELYEGSGPGSLGMTAEPIREFTTHSASWLKRPLEHPIMAHHHGANNCPRNFPGLSGPPSITRAAGTDEPCANRTKEPIPNYLDRGFKLTSHPDAHGIPQIGVYGRVMKESGVGGERKPRNLAWVTVSNLSTVRINIV
ncbi:hypothetical protein B0H16DRAFT_1474340 [Mycena metata]|uniref:Uncharacterized protein n=1 Tax=Mycena metata TaxID=1033252 RepID=A0AAD7MJN2_9AGAR|nr:hypothetical protein B0H16DRAFT_1474340 [Mycena metata]